MGSCVVHEECDWIKQQMKFMFVIVAVSESDVEYWVGEKLN